MESNQELVENLEERGYIVSDRVKDAFMSVDRKDFVPEKYRSRAYQDTPIPIDKNATISAPHMVAKNTELLEVEPDSDVVEIGSGSGYQLAILSQITSGKVLGVERIEELAQGSRVRLDEYSNVEVIHGEGVEDVRREFDRVIFSCGVESLDIGKALVNDNGIIIAPVKTKGGQVLKKYYSGTGEVEDHGFVKFVSYVE